jgi:hypothetical protein
MKKLLIITLAFFLLSVNLTFAQEEVPKYTGILNWLMMLGSWTFLVIVLGGMIVAGSMIFGRARPDVSKYGTLIGLLIIFIGLFGIQIVYITPYLFGKPVLTYTICSESTQMLIPTVPVSGLKITIPDPLASVVIPTSCVFAGYVPTELSWLGLVTFFIFGIILPLALLISVFYYSTDFLTHKGVRSVVTLSLSLIAFRFLLASLFLELLGYGIAGIGLILVDFLLFEILFTRLSKTAAAATQLKLIETGMARARFDELADHYKHAISLGKKDEADNLKKELQKLVTAYPGLKADLDALLKQYKPPKS